MAAEDRRPYDCQRCSWGRHCDASRPAPYKQWEFTYRNEVVFQSNTCPLPQITHDSHALVRLFGHYKNRILPNAGGLLDQPVQYVRAMELLRQVFNEIEAEALARTRKRAESS